MANGDSYDSGRLYELAEELDMLASDLFVIAGQPVPPHLLPPPRDPEVMRAFTASVIRCHRAQLAPLKDWVWSLRPTVPRSLDFTAFRIPIAPLDDGFGDIAHGLMQNRGFGLMEMPFTGLSRASIEGVLDGREFGLQRIKALADALGWRLQDLAAVADIPLGDFENLSILCRHAGEVFVAAIPLTTEQLVQANEQARLRIAKGPYGEPEAAWGHRNCDDLAPEGGV